MSNPSTEPTFGIENAPWWLPHSQVLVREDYLAEDEAWIANQIVQVQNAGTQQASVSTQAGSLNILKVKRMVVQGVVAVKRANGRIKTVNLPHEAGKLLAQDLTYIASQIDALNAPMTAGEQAAFLPTANAPSEGNLTLVK